MSVMLASVSEMAAPLDTVQPSPEEYAVQRINASVAVYRRMVAADTVVQTLYAVIDGRPLCRLDDQGRHRTGHC